MRKSMIRQICRIIRFRGIKSLGMGQLNFVSHLKGGTAFFSFAATILYCAGSLVAQWVGSANDPPTTPREQVLLDRIERLEQRLTALERQLTVAPQSFPSSALDT